MSDALTSDERIRFRQCSEVVSAGVRAYVEMGIALKEIRDSRLYREEYETFTEYCKEVHGLHDSTVNSSIKASEVSANLAVAGLPAPLSKSQAISLAALPKGKQSEVWLQVMKDTKGDPRIADVQRAVFHETHEKGGFAPVTRNFTCDRTVKFSPNQYDWVVVQAKERRISVSGYLRDLIAEDMRRNKKG